MIQDRYAFNNLYPIYTSPALESILSDLSNIRMGEATRRWNIRGIHYLFILASNESREDIKKFMGNLIEKGIGIVFIPETIARFNHEKLFHIHQILKNKLRNGSAEFLYESGMEEDAGNFLNGFSIFQLFESASNGDFLSRIRTEENQHLSNYVLYLKSAVKNGMFLLSEMPDQQLLIEGSEEEKTAETSKDVKKSGKQIFKPSRFTIKIKMMGMISSIILTALSVVIFLASNFFRDASERRVQQTDLAITEIIGQRIEAEIKTIQLNSKTFISSISGAEIAPLKARELSDIFFKSNDEYIFIGVAENQEGQTVFTKQFRNNTFLLKKEIPSSDIDQLHALNSNAFQRVFNGTTLIHNASPGFKIPIIGIGIPYKENIIIVYMDPKNFLNTFKKTGMSTTYMVDDRGFVIAHPDKKIVQSKTNFIELPIVKKAFDSSIPNGQFKYKDKYKDEEKVSYLGSFKRLKIVPLFVISTVPEKEALKEVFDIQRRNIYIMALVLNAALLIVFFYSRSLSIPLIRLVGATKKIEEGDYVVDIKPSSRDEVGILTNSFLTMALGLGEREKMKDALGRFVNKQIAEKVLKGDLTLGGEGKHCAVFFSDLRNFTAMSEGMTPEEVVSYLNQYFTRMVACVNQTGGTVDKFIGDAIMAHWGALDPTGNDTENAVNSALMMRKSLIEFNLDADGDKKPLAKFGCGINTGDVVSGQIGSDERLEFTVIGDAVNLASRVETLNKPFGTDILISQDSYDFVSDIFKVEKMPAIKVKGKSEPQTIYAVIGRFDDPDCPVSLSEVRSIVGIDFDESKNKGGGVFEDKEVKYEVLEK